MSLEICPELDELTYISATMNSRIAQVTGRIVRNGGNGRGSRCRLRCGSRCRPSVRESGSLSIILTVEHGVNDDVSRLLDTEELV